MPFLTLKHPCTWVLVEIG